MKQKICLMGLLCPKNSHYNIQLPMILLAISPFIMCLQARAQQRESFTVTGKVISAASGVAIEGATITNKRSRIHAVTDRLGEYHIPAQPDDVLIYSFVGYVTVEEDVNGREQIIIALDSAANTLEEVEINAGYYTTTRRTSTGNISHIDSETIGKQPVLNPLQALQAAAPGVFVQQLSGVPGDGFSIQVRGMNSLRPDANEPLYVIDGVPYSSESLSTQSVKGFSLNNVSPLNLINPASIQSIEILKDADATAIYGSRGANGVILITTNRTKHEGGFAISLNSYFGLGKAANLPDLLNTDEYISMRKEAFINDGVEPTVVNAPDLLLWDTTRYTDWQKLLLNNYARANNTQLSLTGGTQYTNYSVDISKYYQGTVFHDNFGYRRRSANMQISQRAFNDRMRIHINFRYTKDKNSLPANDPSRMVLNLLPNSPRIYDDSGRYNFENGTFANPVAALNNVYHHSSAVFFSSSSLQLQLTSDISFQASVGYTANMMDELNLETLASQSPDSDPVGTAIHGNGKTTNWIAEPRISFKKGLSIGKLEILLGATFQQDNTKKKATKASGYRNDNLLEDIDAATTLTPYGSTLATYRYMAYYGRLNYTLHDKYIVNMTTRRDGSSRFGPERKFGTFGAIGLAWLFSDERWLANSGWLEHGKLRVSWGTAGSDQIGNFQYMATYNATTYPYNGISGLIPSRLANRDYGWERNRKAEAGLEVGLFKGRIFLAASYYRHRSSNQLVGMPLPMTTGFASIQANLPATVENKGVEIEVNSKIISLEKMSWSMSANLTLPRNKLINFPDIESSTYVNVYKIGLPLSATRLYRYTGIDPNTGLYTFFDMNGDGRINSSDQSVMEGPEVAYFGGINNRVDLKGGISIDFTFRAVKQTGRNFRATANGAPGTRYSNQPSAVLGRWRSVSSSGVDMQRFTQGDTPALLAYAYMRNSDASIGDASFIRLQNVAVSWQPSHLVGWEFTNFRPTIYLQGQNLLTISKYAGADPENQTLQALPPIRMYTVGVRFNYHKY